MDKAKNEVDPGHSRKIIPPAPCTLDPRDDCIIHPVDHTRPGEDINRWERDIDTVRLMESRPRPGGIDDE